MHLARQAVSVRVRKNDRSRSPVITAPIMLVAANSIASSIIAKKIVAIMAPRSTESVVLIQQGRQLLQQLIDTVVSSIMARYTTAMPKTTHKNAGVTVMAAVILRNAAIIPTAMLIIRATVVQVFLHEQSLFDIYITSRLHYMIKGSVR
jgi:hypothetical protein